MGLCGVCGFFLSGGWFVFNEVASHYSLFPFISEVTCEVCLCVVLFCVVEKQVAGMRFESDIPR